jgi:catalase-peroxidase
MRTPTSFADTFARAWFKLTHRDMGPKVRAMSVRRSARGRPDLAGSDSRGDHPLSMMRTSQRLKAKISAAALSVSELVQRPGPLPRPIAARTSAAGPMARASALRRRRTGRQPARAGSQRCCRRWKCIQADFNADESAQEALLADLIVLAGNRRRSKRPLKCCGCYVVRALSRRAMDASDDHDRRRKLRCVSSRRHDAFRNY